jgi:hypothetical protein
MLQSDSRMHKQALELGTELYPIGYGAKINYRPVKRRPLAFLSHRIACIWPQLRRTKP